MKNICYFIGQTPIRICWKYKTINNNKNNTNDMILHTLCSSICFLKVSKSSPYDFVSILRIRSSVTVNQSDSWSSCFLCNSISTSCSLPRSKVKNKLNQVKQECLQDKISKPNCMLQAGFSPSTWHACTKCFSSKSSANYEKN